VRRAQGLELRIRVGLNSGEVVVRTIGNDLHMDYSVVGQTTHLAARIDRLAREDKHVLQCAAVIGTEVPFSLVQGIAELPEAVLHRSLAHLQAAEFLYETRLFPEHEYAFKHALTHEVAYGSLLQERRRALHALIGEALEALAGDRVVEQVERLAHHALRGEVWDKAPAYCWQMGEKAMARSAHREAVGYFEQALSALRHLPEQRATREQAIDLRLALRSALAPSGHSGRILANLREAEALAEALDDPRRLGQVSFFLALHFRNRGAYDQAIASGQRALAERALALAHAHQERGNQAYALRLLGDIAARRELPECGPAEAHYRQALALADELGMRPLVAHCHLGLGTLYRQMGRVQEARTGLSVAIELYRTMEMTFWLPQADAALVQVD
jgi:predicted ATPase